MQRGSRQGEAQAVGRSLETIVGQFCDSCCFLVPDERHQKPDEPHVCQLYGYILRHLGHHPRIPKPIEGCSGPYEKENDADDPDYTPNGKVEAGVTK